MSGSDRETRPEVREPIPDDRECTRDPLGCPGVIVRPSRMSGSGRESLSDVRE